MKNFFKRFGFAYPFAFFILLSLLLPAVAQERAVDEIKIIPLPDGYQITASFLFALQYQSHTPKKPAKELYVQLKTTDFKTLTSEEIDSLRQRLSWGPQPQAGELLREIIFEGGNPERPQMTFLFTEDVSCDVRSGGNLRSLIIKVKTKKPEAAKEKKEKWTVQNFGSFSQFYFRDQTVPEGGQVRVNRSDLTSDLDFHSRWKSEDMYLAGRFTGGHLQSLLKEGGSRDTLSALSLEMRPQKNSWSGKFGRQTLNTGGVLGRFDGSHFGLKLSPVVKANAVLGFPVESVRQMEVETDRPFYGMNFDFGTFVEKWNFNTFFINQQNHSFTDRQALGLEARYSEPKKSFFSLLDYDIFFKKLALFLFNGRWTLPTKTTVNLILDYRKSPFLTLNNALQGQGVSEISDLSARFSGDQIKQLALDRSADSKTATIVITQDIKKDWQLSSEVSVSELEGTISSGGVEGAEGAGKEYTYSAQLIGNNVFKENDLFISGVTFAHTAKNNTYTLNLNANFPLTPKLRVLPKFRVDYRDAKKSDDNRFGVRPAVRVDYRFREWMHFEAEAGLERLNEKISGSKQQSTETFVSAGFRINF